MAPTAGPTITSVTRHSSDPTILVVTYTVPVSGVTRVQLWEKGPTGNPVRIVDTTSLVGTISVHSRYAAYVPVTLHMTLTHNVEGASNPGGTVSVPAFVVPAPTLVSAARNSATTALLTYSGLTVGFGARGYVYRSAPGGNPVQVGAFDITASSGSRSAPAPNGTVGYDFELRVGQHGILSAPSTRRTVEAWFQLPPAPTLGTPSRNTTTGAVSLAWSNPTYTSRNRPTGFRYYRALSGSPKPATAWRTVTGQPTSLSDATATSLARGYTYWIEPYNELGRSSSAPSVTVAAVRELPNAATGLTATQPVPLTGDRHRFAWSTTPTTVRPVTSQAVQMRTPGTTAWSTLATVAGSTTQVDLDLPVNRVLEFQVVTTNDVGAAASGSNIQGPIVTTPRGPGPVSGMWTGPSTIAVLIGASATAATVADIEFSTQASPDPANSAHWFPAASGLALPVPSWPHTGLSQTSPHTYRVRYRHATSGKASTWDYSARVDAQATPHPPTMDMPTAIDADEAIELRLRHNPVDGTSQTAGQIRYRLQGTTPWTTRTLSPGTSTSYVIAAGTYTNGGYLEVQGRTAGATGAYGEWGHGTVGASLLVPLRALPVATITSPQSGVITSQGFWLEWDAPEQVSGLIAININSDLVATPRFGADVRRWWIDGYADGDTVQPDLIISDAWQSGLMQTLDLTVALELPAPPGLTARVDNADASVHLTAVPRRWLELRRSSDAQRMAAWTESSGTATVGRATLTLPDGSTVETTSINGAGTVRTLETVTVEGEFSAAGLTAAVPFGGSIGAVVRLGRQEGGTTVWGDLTGLPSTGEPVQLRTVGSTGGAAQRYLLQIQSPPAAEVHIWDGMAVGAPDPADLDDPTFFDGDTVRDGYVYGWLSSGLAYEAIPVGGEPSYSVPVAPTARIEIWCSPTGDDDSYTYCGDTLTDWTHHDRHPAIGVPVWYMARAYTEAGAWADSDPVSVVVNSCDAHLAWGDDWQHSAHAGWEPSYTGSGGRRHTTRRAIGEGGEDRLGVVYGPKLARETTARLTIRTRDGDTPLCHWEDASETKGHVIYRDPAGRVYVGPMRGFTWDDSDEEDQQISFTVTRIRERP